MKRQDFLNNLEALTKNGSFIHACHILGAADNDLRTEILEKLVINNIPFVLATISTELIRLVHHIYNDPDDCEDGEKEYLENSLVALQEYKEQITKLQEYADLKKKTANIIDNIYDCHQQILECKLHEYECQVNKIIL